MSDDRLILELLRAHEAACRQWPYLLTRYRENVPFNVLVLDEIEASLDRDFAVEPLYDYWRRAPSEYSPYECAQVLHEILELINGHYSNLTPEHFETDGELLVLGRRWWIKRDQAFGGTLRPKTIYHPFPHLRRLPGAGSSWHRVDILGRYDPAWTEDKLRVGLCTLSGHASTQFDGTATINERRSIFGFRATHLLWTISHDSIADYHDELRQAVRWAKQSGVHILCLPELCVCPEGREVIKEEVGDDPGSLRLVVPGSFHQPHGGDASADVWTNAAPVWMFHPDATPLFREVTRVVKGDLFELPVSRAAADPRMVQACTKAEDASCAVLLEDVHAATNLQMLDTPIGLIGVLICKDAIFEGNPVRQRLLRLVDHLIVVSMNGSSQAGFLSSAGVHAMENLMATFFVNSAQGNVPYTASGTVEAAFGALPSRVRVSTCAVTYQPAPRLSAASSQAPPAMVRHVEGRHLLEIDIPESVH